MVDRPKRIFQIAKELNISHTEIIAFLNDKGVKVKNIVKFLIKRFDYKGKVVFEKNIRGWKGDIPFYSYSTKKMNKMGYKFKLNSALALKKTINKISKKTLF